MDLVSVFLPDSTTNMVGLVGTYYQAGNAVACLQHSFLSFHTQKEYAFRKQSLLMKRLADQRTSLDMNRTLKLSLSLLSQHTIGLQNNKMGSGPQKMVFCYRICNFVNFYEKKMASAGRNLKKNLGHFSPSFYWVNDTDSILRVK